MSTFGLIEYKDANPTVKAVYGRHHGHAQTDYINNSLEAIAHDPALLKRTWKISRLSWARAPSIRLTKELLYIAVSVTNIATIASLPTPRRHLPRHDPGNVQELQAVIAWPTKPTNWSPATRLPWTPAFNRLST